MCWRLPLDPRSRVRETEISEGCYDINTNLTIPHHIKYLRWRFSLISYRHSRASCSRHSFYAIDVPASGCAYTESV